MADTLITYGPHNAPNKFYTKRGQLTDYALHCGYVERRTSMDIVTELYHDGCYHVRTNGAYFGQPHVWDVADTLTEARRKFAKHVKEYHR